MNLVPFQIDPLSMKDVTRDIFEPIPLYPSSITPALAFRMNMTVERLWELRGRLTAEGKPIWASPIRTSKLN